MPSARRAQQIARPARQIARATLRPSSAPSSIRPPKASRSPIAMATASSAASCAFESIRSLLLVHGEDEAAPLACPNAVVGRGAARVEPGRFAGLSGYVDPPSLLAS